MKHKFLILLLSVLPLNLSSCNLQIEYKCPTVTFGSYPTTKDGGKRKIQWLVLQEDDDSEILLSKYVLDRVDYNDSYESDFSWETCTLRKWLNTDFYNMAFSEEERKRIRLSTVKTPATDEVYPVSEYLVTLDYIYIDNYLDMFDYKDRPQDFPATDYAKEQGVDHCDGSEFLFPDASYWRRSRGNQATFHHVGSGRTLSITDSGIESISNIGFLPMLQISK